MFMNYKDPNWEMDLVYELQNGLWNGLNFIDNVLPEHGGLPHLFIIYKLLLILGVLTPK